MHHITYQTAYHILAFARQLTKMTFSVASSKCWEVLSSSKAYCKAENIELPQTEWARLVKEKAWILNERDIEHSKDRLSLHCPLILMRREF